MSTLAPVWNSRPVIISLLKCFSYVINATGVNVSHWPNGKHTASSLPTILTSSMVTSWQTLITFCAQIMCEPTKDRWISPYSFEIRLRPVFLLLQMTLQECWWSNQPLRLMLLFFLALVLQMIEKCEEREILLWKKWDYFSHIISYLMVCKFLPIKKCSMVEN